MHLQQILRNLDNDLGTLYQKTGLKSYLRDHSKMTSPGQGEGGRKKVQKTVTSIV